VPTLASGRIHTGIQHTPGSFRHPSQPAGPVCGYRRGTAHRAPTGGGGGGALRGRLARACVPSGQAVAVVACHQSLLRSDAEPPRSRAPSRCGAACGAARARSAAEQRGRRGRGGPPHSGNRPAATCGQTRRSALSSPERVRFLLGLLSPWRWRGRPHLSSPAVGGGREHEGIRRAVGYCVEGFSVGFSEGFSGDEAGPLWHRIGGSGCTLAPHPTASDARPTPPTRPAEAASAVQLKIYDLYR